MPSPTSRGNSPASRRAGTLIYFPRNRDKLCTFVLEPLKHLSPNMLVSSERKNKKVESKNYYNRKEFSYRAFQRSFAAAENAVLGEKISAKYSDGILKIVLQKREEIKRQPEREIKIS